MNVPKLTVPLFAVSDVSSALDASKNSAIKLVLGTGGGGVDHHAIGTRQNDVMFDIFFMILVYDKTS